MDLRPDELQDRLAAAVRSALTRPGDPWREVGAVGVPAVSLPVSAGGLGLGLSADIMVNLELGRALETLPGYRETVLAADLLAAAGMDRAAPLLADVAVGKQRIAAVGVHAAPTLECDPDGLVRGLSEPLEAIDWPMALIRARSDGADRWLLVKLGTDADALEPTSVLGLPAVRLRLAGVPGTILAVAPDHVLRAVAAARIRQAAFLLGVAARAFEVARDHVHRRQQFGRALVAFQTVSHRLAALLAEADGWMLLLHETAWRHDRGEDATQPAAEILAASAEHALQASRLAVQLHGVRGMLAHSTPATAYRIAAVEGLRLGPPRRLWLEVGRGRLAEHASTAPTISSGGCCPNLRP